MKGNYRLHYPVHSSGAFYLITPLQGVPAVEDNKIDHRLCLARSQRWSMIPEVAVPARGLVDEPAPLPPVVGVAPQLQVALLSDGEGLRGESRCDLETLRRHVAEGHGGQEKGKEGN